jgi:hypothetical protein
VASTRGRARPGADLARDPGFPDMQATAPPRANAQVIRRRCRPALYAWPGTRRQPDPRADSTTAGL